MINHIFEVKDRHKITFSEKNSAKKSHFRETGVLFRKNIHFWKVSFADLLDFPHYFHAAFFGDVDLCSRFENEFQGRISKLYCIILYVI